ncbi:MAG: polysaccharide biosynthesis C-terminal domain-containing protein [Micropruina sp.]|uniref:lipopolysaccharide biosynthesis protein n=1 Tax=Micropruina sp. TaxID=2737536 RepID=UPI0039E63127
MTGAGSTQHPKAAGDRADGAPDASPERSADSAGGSVQQQRAEPGLFRRLAGGAGWQALAQMSPLVFNLALTPYLIRGFGIGLYGVFLLIAVIQRFIASMDGGVGGGARRYFGILTGRGDRAGMTSLLTSLFVITSVASAVLCTLLWFAAPAIMSFFPGAAEDLDGSVYLLRVMIVLAGLAQVRGIFTQVLLTANLFRFTALGDLLGFFAYATGMILAVQFQLGLVGIAWAFIAQQVFPTLMVVPTALGRLERGAIRFAPGSLVKDFFRYSWKIQISGTLTLLADYGDSLFVGRFAAPQMTAFGTGASFANTMRGIPFNGMVPMDANIVREIGQHGPSGAVDQVAKIQRLWVRLIAGWIAVGAPAAGFGVTVWLNLGTDLPGQVAAVVLLAYGVSLSMLVQRLWLNGLGRSGLTLSYDVINMVLNLSLTFPLILSFGVAGTISATLAAAICAAGYLTWVGQRRVEIPLPTPWSEVPWLSVLAASALAAACCWATAHYVVGSIVPHGALALLTMGAAAAPALALYLIHIVGFSRLRSMFVQVRSKGRR